MEKEKHKNEELFCPVGRFFAHMENHFGGTSEFFGHINNSRVEFLKAIRSLVDEKIANLEKQETRKKGKKSTKIKVESA
jgi:hypothetical protein